jgi:hypothetical protein
MKAVVALPVAEAALRHFFWRSSSWTEVVEKRRMSWEPAGPLEKPKEYGVQHELPKALRGAPAGVSPGATKRSRWEADEGRGGGEDRSYARAAAWISEPAV